MGVQEQLPLARRAWGGCRAGAGRKPAPGRRAVPHSPRAAHVVRHPVHVTLRATHGLPSLRAQRVFGVLCAALRAASGDEFRVLHFSVQADHVHLLVEADAARRLPRGIQGLAIRAARAINRVLARHGHVWGDRYHARSLATPREVRNALVYVLNNWRKHVPESHGVDPCSSALWFEGWKVRPSRSPGAPMVASPRTWLARIGWKMHGLIAVGEAPASRSRIRGRRNQQ
jgi:REP element-mobilizing transposase RayT